MRLPVECGMVERAAATCSPGLLARPPPRLQGPAHRPPRALLIAALVTFLSRVLSTSQLSFCFSVSENCLCLSEFLYSFQLLKALDPD